MLELSGLECVRGVRTVFTAISAHLHAGELLRVQGANGAGKTSLLRMICGLLAPNQGQIRWHGHPIASLREEYSRQLVYLGHAAALKDELTVRENLHVSSTLAGVAVSDSAAESALVGAGLRARAALPVGALSQGQKRRVALARLIVSDAVPLWVLDEPFNALDAHAVQWLLVLIAKHLDRGGIVVLTSHQQPPISTLRAVDIEL